MQKFLPLTLFQVAIVTAVPDLRNTRFSLQWKYDNGTSIDLMNWEFSADPPGGIGWRTPISTVNKSSTHIPEEIMNQPLYDSSVNATLADLIFFPKNYETNPNYRAWYDVDADGEMEILLLEDVMRDSDPDSHHVVVDFQAQDDDGKVFAFCIAQDCNSLSKNLLLVRQMAYSHCVEGTCLVEWININDDNIAEDFIPGTDCGSQQCPAPEISYKCTYTDGIPSSCCAVLASSCHFDEAYQGSCLDTAHEYQCTPIKYRGDLAFCQKDGALLPLHTCNNATRIV